MGTINMDYQMGIILTWRNRKGLYIMKISFHIRRFIIFTSDTNIKSIKVHEPNLILTNI